MASRTCGFCGYNTHLTLSWRNLSRLGSGEVLLQGAYSCDHCKTVSVATLHNSSAMPQSDDQADHLFETGPTQWAPLKVEGRHFSDVPAHVAAAADEAYRCLNFGAVQAAILMARTTIEAAAKSVGVTKGVLKAKIKTMVEQGVLRPELGEVADAIRDLGNEQAHGDIEDPATEEDAADVLELMSEVLSEVYQRKARMNALLARTAARRGGTAS